MTGLIGYTHKAQITCVEGGFIVKYVTSTSAGYQPRTKYIASEKHDIKLVAEWLGSMSWRE